MTVYTAPLADMHFVLRELVDLDVLLAEHPSGLTPDLIDSVLSEAARFASNALSPTDISGDREGARLTPEGVITPSGYRDAYRMFVEAGWHALPCEPEYGGQGFPRVVSALVDEMWRASNIALTGCVALTRSAIEALSLRASDEIRQLYLPPLIEGRWTGTMNLTEPQAGSDLSAIRTRAIPNDDGTYRIFGQKIFITWGEHDMSENIVHLVLARTPDAPSGVKGISMFLVPKFLPNADGTLGERNNAKCIAIEDKVGQSGAATTIMVHGGDEPGSHGQNGAVGFLIGELNRGLETMFIMMNEARFAVGLEGLAISERAYQTAVAYARERIQGVEIGGQERVAIIRHPDVRRMLMRMRSGTEAMRALSITLAAQVDEVRRQGHDEQQASTAKAMLDLLTPIMKGWNTEMAVRLTSIGVQIHGGMGFMNECQAAQHWKDSRILPIYEGTTGIQANDLVARKVARDKGNAARALLLQMTSTAEELNASTSEDLRVIGSVLSRAVNAASRCIEFIVTQYDEDPRIVLAGSVPFLELMGLTTAGWQMGRAALAAHRRVGNGNAEFLAAKITTARFFAEHEMIAVSGLSLELISGGASALALPEDRF